MEQTTTPPSKVFHVRMTSALASLWLVDTLFIIYTSESVLLEGATVILMFAMEVRTLGPLARSWSSADLLASTSSSWRRAGPSSPNTP